MTQPHPEGEGAVRAMRGRCRDAGRRPVDRVGYVNAHGTSTPPNDRIETLALKRVFGEKVPPVSSTKSMTGHTLGAAGALEAVICVQALQHQTLPPTINQENPDPDCDLDYVPNQSRAGVDRGRHDQQLRLRRAQRQPGFPSARAVTAGRRQAVTMTNSMLAWQATWPPTRAVPWPRPGARPQLVELDLELEGVARADLAAEPGLVDPAEQRQLARVPLVGQQGDPAELGQRLDHQHTGQGGPAREVAGEERLLARSGARRPLADCDGTISVTSSTNRNGGRWGSTSSGRGQARRPACSSSAVSAPSPGRRRRGSPRR